VWILSQSYQWAHSTGILREVNLGSAHLRSRQKVLHEKVPVEHVLATVLHGKLVCKQKHMVMALSTCQSHDQVKENRKATVIFNILHEFLQDSTDDSSDDDFPVVATAVAASKLR
jgi:hypothetical protein